MIWYCDSSALVKRYVQETGSRWFRQQLARHRLLASTLILAEVLGALARRERQGTISKFEIIRGRHEFAQHWGKGQYTVWPIILSIVQQAAQLTYRHPLAAYDAVHLATALDYVNTTSVNLKQYFFLTANEQLQRAAEAEGLQTENPNEHP